MPSLLQRKNKPISHRTRKETKSKKKGPRIKTKLPKIRRLSLKTTRNSNPIKAAPAYLKNPPRCQPKTETRVLKMSVGPKSTP